MFVYIKSMLKKIPIFRRLKIFLFPHQYQVYLFLSNWFKQDNKFYVIQAGANDGEMCDPLREFLIHPGKYEATLIEPIPFYVNKLTELYKNRSDVSIVQAAVGSESISKKLYFIPPEIADLMNGNGPQNN